VCQIVPHISQSELFDLIEAVRMGRDGSARDLRIRLGLSARDIASLCPVSPSALSRWETGERRPTGLPAVNWVRLLRRLGEADRLARATPLADSPFPDPNQIVRKAPGGNQGPSLTQPNGSKRGLKGEVVDSKA
jgi:hypothetical protein